MTWVRRTEPEQKHECAPPMRCTASWIEIAYGEPGDLWRCDDCGTLWEVGQMGLAWLPATWWQRWRHRKDGRQITVDGMFRALGVTDLSPPVQEEP